MRREACSVERLPRQPVILTEVADVLNMRLASIDDGEWNSDLAVEQRRHLNGRYHMYIDEDLLEALFLQYMGVKWSIFFKKAFKDFANFDGAWSPLNEPIPANEIANRNYFLGAPYHIHSNIQDKRTDLYKSIYFMSQLLDAERDDKADEDGAEEAQYQDVPRVPFPRQTTARLANPTQNYEPRVGGTFQTFSVKLPPQNQGSGSGNMYETILDDESNNLNKPPKTPMEIK